MIELYANNAETNLASSISASQTVITVTAGTGNLFPSPVSGVSQFRLTLVSAITATVYEICICTARSGDSLTIIRGQEGTSPTAFSVNDFAGNFDTAAVMNNLIQEDQLQKQTYTSATAGGTANALTATIPSKLTTIPNGLNLTIYSIYANTGACTLVLTLGSLIQSSVPIVKNGNNPLTGGEIPSAGFPIQLVYSSIFNAFVIQSQALISFSEPPQFDNSNSVATTSFVQRALGNFQSVNQYTNQTATIPASWAGQIIVCGGSDNALTLPSSASVPIGTAFTFFGQGGVTTITAGGSDILTIGANASNNTVSLLGSDFCTIVLQISGVWGVANGTPMLPASGGFAHNFAQNGYQKLPSGLIMQWGTYAYTASGAQNISISFPISFPNAVLSAQISSSDRLSNTFIGSQVAACTLSSFGFGSVTASGSGAQTVSWVAIGY